jgi:NAD(P)-dependent dehydrogenase (short-subunit alcohol dehydrogenase family)
MPTPLKFPEAATYVLAGGLGGIGRSIARWMASRGARNFVFLSRSGARSSEAQGLIAHLEKNGCRAASYICDIADKSQLAAIIAECQTTLPPIKGCIHGCMALEVSISVDVDHVSISLLPHPPPPPPSQPTERQKCNNISLT